MCINMMHEPISAQRYINITAVHIYNDMKLSCCSAFSRRLYSQRLWNSNSDTMEQYFEQWKIKGIAQESNSGNFVVLGLEPVTEPVS